MSKEPTNTLKYTYSLDHFNTPKNCNFCSIQTHKLINPDDHILSHVKSEDRLSQNDSN